MAKELGISEFLLALILIAVGTSIPELAFGSSAAGFSFVKVNEFQGIKIFKTMEDAISYLRESGHFVFSEPFAPLSEDEVQKIVNNKAEFEITCHNEKVIGVPYDSLLIIARKS